MVSNVPLAVAVLHCCPAAKVPVTVTVSVCPGARVVIGRMMLPSDESTSVTPDSVTSPVLVMTYRNCGLVGAMRVGPGGVGAAWNVAPLSTETSFSKPMAGASIVAGLGVMWTPAVCENIRKDVVMEYQPPTKIAP